MMIRLLAVLLLIATPALADPIGPQSTTPLPLTDASGNTVTSIGTTAVQIAPAGVKHQVVIQILTAGSTLACSGLTASPVIGTTGVHASGQYAELFWSPNGVPPPSTAIYCVASQSTAVYGERN